jgi:lysyl-tRNA synthetase class 2
MVSMSLEDIRNKRLKKLSLLKGKGVDVFPISVRRDFSVSEALKNFSKLSKKKKSSFLAGRITAVRGHGGAVFFDVNDGSASIQAFLKKDEAGEKEFALFRDAIDIGDFVEIRGTFFLTQKKEKTLKVSKWAVIAKSLRPLPEKWHGLTDTEERFRRRYLDLLMSNETKQRFLLRSRIISEIRNFYDKSGYTEVEAPVLQPLAGGATAAPFVTHHNALNTDLYLSIAQELYLKELLVGGFEKVYAIGKIFRNEGIDVTHNPEFTMLESQEAYSDASRQMIFIENLFKTLVKKIFRKNYLEFKGEKIDFSRKFAIVSYLGLFKKYVLISEAETMKKDDWMLKAKQFGVKTDGLETKEKIMDAIYKKICRPKLIQPTFIVDYPAETSPFAKSNPQKKEFVDRFQLVINGLEIVNAFSELNDPIEQKERFLEQDKKKKAGDAEVSPSDDQYLEAMEYGMPPNGGIGIGIDRVVMLFTNSYNIREVILFPVLRPKQ